MKCSFLIFLLSLFALLSCKKDKLEGDKEIFIGTWNWYKTTKINSLCDPPSFESELNPMSEDESFALRFYEKGMVEFYQNSEIIYRDRVVFFSFNTGSCQDPGYKDFAIYLNNDPEKLIQGCVSSDSITLIRDFPFPDPESNCENYTSYFVKQ